MTDPFHAGVAGVVLGLGKTGTLTTAGGDTTLGAIIQRDFNQLDEFDAIADRGDLLTFAKAQLPGTLKNGDKFVVGDETFVIQRTVADDGYSVQVLAR